MTLLRELQHIVGSENAFQPKERYLFQVDSLTPQVIALPASYEEVASIMALANESRIAVIPGEPSLRMIVGNAARRYDIALSLERLNAVLEYEPADLTITCQAGINVNDLQSQLEANGQMVPFGLPNTDKSTIGGLIASNHSTLQLTHGTPRDFTIGLRVVTADGRITRAGGKVVKNVAGYDLCKLYIGSRGTLGVIVEATFKVFPLPEARALVELEFVRLEDACEFSNEAFKLGLSLSRMSIDRLSPTNGFRFTKAGEYVLRAELAGTMAAVERSKRHLQGMASSASCQYFEKVEMPDSISKDLFRGWQAALECEISALPTRLPDIVEAIDLAAPGAHISSILPIQGSLRAAWRDAQNDDRLIARVRDATSGLSGSLIVHWCSAELKRRIDVFGDPPPSFELMRRIKQEFDPNGTLSPGRFVGRL